MSAAGAPWFDLPRSALIFFTTPRTRSSLKVFSPTRNFDDALHVGSRPLQGWHVLRLEHLWFLHLTQFVRLDLYLCLPEW